MQVQINALAAIENTSICTTESKSLKQKLEKDLKAENLKLKRLQQNQGSQKRYGEKKKLVESFENNPTLSNICLNKEVGRSRIEDAQPELLETIMKIIELGGAVDPKRRTEITWTCKTLDELEAELETLGFKISRSALYLRLIPKRINSTEGLKHVNTVPVKLVKAQTSEHKGHADTDFWIANIRALESLASLLGPHQVFFLSADDKCRVPLGITAAKKQVHNQIK